MTNHATVPEYFMKNTRTAPKITNASLQAQFQGTPLEIVFGRPGSKRPAPRYHRIADELVAVAVARDQLDEVRYESALVDEFMYHVEIAESVNCDLQLFISFLASKGYEFSTTRSGIVVTSAAKRWVVDPAHLVSPLMKPLRRMQKVRGSFAVDTLEFRQFAARIRWIQKSDCEADLSDDNLARIAPQLKELDPEFIAAAVDAAYGAFPGLDQGVERFVRLTEILAKIMDPRCPIPAEDVIEIGG